LIELGDRAVWKPDFNRGQLSYFRNCLLDGTCVNIYDKLREWALGWQMTVSQARSHAILDSQSVKSAAMVSLSVSYDAGQKREGKTVSNSNTLANLRGFTT
jgi:hypothetical protein